MKKALFIFLFFCALSASPALAVNTAPRISDREIIEKLAKLEQGQKNLDKRFGDVNKRFGDVNKRFDDVNRRFDGVNKRIDDLRSDMNRRFEDLRSDMNRRFEILTWMLGLFISIATIILAFVLRILWIMQKRQTAMEISLKNQKEDFAFLKNLIEKLLPPKGVL